MTKPENAAIAVAAICWRTVSRLSIAAASHAQQLTQALQLAPVCPCQSTGIAGFQFVNAAPDVGDKARAEDEMRGSFVAVTMMNLQGVRCGQDRPRR
jgi:hypothetical protein